MSSVGAVRDAGVATLGIKSAIAQMPVNHVAFAGFTFPVAATWLPLILAVTVQFASLGLVLYKWRLEVAKNTPANAPPRNYTRLILGAVAAIALAFVAFFTFRSSRAMAAPVDGDMPDGAGAMPGVGGGAEPDYFRDAGQDVTNGTCEIIAGGRSNPEVDAMWTAVGWSPKTDSRKNAWCSTYINHRLLKRGIRGTGSARALSFLTWARSVELADAQPGDVVVYRRRVGGRWDGKTGHVNFFVKRVGNRVLGRGGNQSNCVTDAYFPVRDVLAVRRPRHPRPAPPVTVDRGRVVAAGGAAGGVAAGGTVVSGALDDPAPTTNNVPEMLDTAKRIGETAQEPLFNLGTASAIKIAVCIGIGCTALTIVGLWYSHSRAKPTPQGSDDHA